MSKREIEKYRVDCGEPGMQITGAGYFFGGGSVVPPNTILEIPAGGLEPRSCMTPLNDAARAAFERLRLRVAKEWRECLPKGLNPDGDPLEGIAGKSLSKEEIENLVKRMVAKVGPDNREVVREAKKMRPRLAAGALRASKAPAAKAPELDEDDGIPAPSAASGHSARASDN